MQNQNQKLNSKAEQNKHFQEMKVLALQKRLEYNIDSKKLNLNVIKRIYKAEEIILDYRKVSGRIRAAYFCDDVDCSVLANSTLPRIPKIFSLIHELKHHFVDRDKIIKGEVVCGDYNENKTIEVGAEIFAAEFIYPETEMLSDCEEFGISCENCTKENVVNFKRYCKAPISYTFIEKRFEFFNFVSKGTFKDVQFQKLEDSMYPPIYKQDWFIKERRTAKKTVH
jgi:Zn-dependent peptidase ImmA (M78 family)